uniref:Alpha-1,3/1,6-mannosyltransferase ALG2 n=1 Tax=Lygus hesperus TaxID=30085 RepID=A0A0A9YLX1_LYGHE
MKGEVVFLHPDLGVGGAERLAVDAAIALQNDGYKVSFVTSYHNENHCFQETKDGTLHVDVVGGWIPRNLFGRFFALFAYLKMIYCSFYILFFRKPDVVFCDLVSVCIPVLKMKVKKVIFYCHFPDQLLSKKEGFLKAAYRIPLNWMEEKTTGMADKIFVNSAFTKSVFKNTFSSLRIEPDILHPSINTGNIDKTPVESKKVDDFIFLSVNRYERKKYVEIAVKAMKTVLTSVKKEENGKIKLYVVGGFDPRVDENVEYFDELNLLVESLGLEGKVQFFKSPSDAEKTNLLRQSDCLVYTPPNEHFGIVPLEAMYVGKPVVACNSGGPTETVVHEKTGLLCDFDPEDFAKAMLRIYNDSSLRSSMGAAGHKRFNENFSFQSFSQKLSAEVAVLLGLKKQD